MAKNLIISKELNNFVIKDVKPTGNVLGHGSFGVVNEVKTARHGMCAGKVIHEILLGPGSIVGSKYLQECQIMSELNHPNIAKFVGVCFLKSLSSLPVLLMEKLDQSLDEYLEKTSDISLARKTCILQDIARGLVYLHDRHPPIIHRDLTSKNVLLTAELKAKITDFGNSRFVDLRPGQLPTQCPGTLVYMPPEAYAEGTPYDPSLDIFSFGHLALYVAVQTFPGELLGHNFRDKNSGKLEARSEVDRRGIYFKQLETQELSDGTFMHVHPLVGTIKKCLDNEPKERYNAKELLATLQGMSTTDVDASLHKVIERWNETAKRSDPVVLVLAGKAGVGKSTLVNNFLGLKSKKSKRAKTAAGGKSGTTEVAEYEEKVKEITVKIIDTPGLGAVDLKEAQVKSAIAMLNAYTDDGKADLLLYCISMKGGRIDEGDVTIIRTLTKAFKDKIWERCVLVMTHADGVLDDLDDSDSEEDGDSKQSLESVMETYCSAFNEALNKAGVSTITSIQSGLSMNNELPSPSTLIAVPAGKKSNKPPQWISLLFREVLKKCDADAIPAMLTLHGMKWKKIAYFLSMNYVQSVTSFTLETTDAFITRNFGTVGPLKKLINAGIDYATILQARAKVSEQRSEGKKRLIWGK